MSRTAEGVHVAYSEYAARRKPSRVKVGMLLVLLVGLLIKEPELLLPIGPDQGTYSYVAERILEGGVPYVDAWDNKPPATYYIHAAALALVPHDLHWTGTCIPGTTQPCGYVALQLLDVLWTIGTGAVLFALVRSLRFDATQTQCALLLFAVFANLSQLSKEGPTPEKQLLLPMVLAYLAVVRGRLGLAGLAAGVAFLFKQTAVSIPIALLAWNLWEFRAFAPRRVVEFSIGFGVALLVPMLYFVARGDPGALWAAAFAYNLVQAGTGAPRIVYGALAGSWHVFSNSSAALWLLGLGGALLVQRSAQQRLLVCWAAADVLSLFLGGSKFAQVYYVQLVPSLALLGGLALAYGWRATRGAPVVRGYVCVLLAAVVVLSNQFQASVALRAWNERTPGRSSVPFEEQLALRLSRENPASLFVWGDNSGIYLYAGKRSPSRFFQTFALSGVYASGFGQRRSELLQQFQTSPPSMIAIDPATSRDDPDGAQGLNVKTFPELQQFIAERYAALDNVGGGWQVFRLRA